MINPNCSELVVTLDIDDDDKIDIVKHVAENFGNNEWKLAAMHWADKRKFFPIKPENIEKLVKSDVSEMAEMDDDTYEAGVFKININELLDTFNLTKSQKKKEMKIFNQNITYLVLAKNLKYGKIEKKDNSYICISAHDAYCDVDSLEFQISDYEIEHFPMLKKIKDSLDGNLHSHDGGSTGAFEDWEEYWEKWGDKSKEEKFVDALDCEIKEDYGKTKPI